MGMTKQFKLKTGGRGIQWTDETWNPVGGCLHGCQWAMPDGEIAGCYAKDVAERVASSAYPQGFEAHYFRKGSLKDPINKTTPLLIFCDSMSDLMGPWVKEEHRAAVFGAIEKAPQHTFQLLTKAAPQYLKLESIPANVWVMASTPPDFMFGKPLNRKAQEKMLTKTLDVLGEIKKRHGNITGLSAEPLSWDISQILADHDHVLDWLIVGAATNGNQKFQPDPEHTQALLDVCDDRGIPVFMKGNLDWSPFREDFPVPPPPYDAAVRRRQAMAEEHGWPTNNWLVAHDRYWAERGGRPEADQPKASASDMASQIELF